MGFMNKLKEKANTASASVMESSRKATAKTKVAAGSLVSAADMPASFHLEPAVEPMLAGSSATLISGANTLSGQVYVTPRFLCVLTFSAGREVRLTLPHRDLQAIQRVFCARGESSSGSLAVGPPPPGEGPNTLRMCYADGTMHTFIKPSDGVTLANWLHVMWDLARSSPSPSAPIRPPDADEHHFFAIDRRCQLLGVHKTYIVSGTEKLKGFLCIFEGHIALAIGGKPDPEVDGGRPYIIPAASVQYLARASVEANPDPMVAAPICLPHPSGPCSSKLTGLVLYTADGLRHELTGVKHVQLAYNRLVHVVAVAIRQQPQFW